MNGYGICPAPVAPRPTRRHTAMQHHAAHAIDGATCRAIVDHVSAIAGDGSITFRAVAHAVSAPHRPRRATVGTLAEAEGVSRRSLDSRLWRSGVRLKDLFDRIVLVRLAAILGDPSISLAAAAATVGCSSSQHGTRFIERLRDTTPSDWRATEPYSLEFKALIDAIARSVEQEGRA